MSNIINSQNITANNISQNVGFAKKEDKSYIKATQYLPSYSVSSAIKERDEFRRNVTEEQEMYLNKQQKKIPKAIFVIAAAIGALLLFIKKKTPVKKS